MNKLIIKNLGLCDYLEVWQKMKQFTNSRIEKNQDEIWFCEHPKVFTVGCRNSENHILAELHSIPLIQTDRGGLITHHGPGQIMMYILLDLRRYKLSVRALVSLLQTVVINTLAEFKLKVYSDDSRPGVFIKIKEKNKNRKVESKICSIGLRISKGKSCHGLSLNYDMDLSPFKLINPCGYSGLKMTNVIDFLKKNAVSKKEIIAQLTDKISKELNID